MFVDTVRDIRVSAQPEFIEHESDFERGVFTFAYTITIENRGPETVQLLERHWVVRSAGEIIAEVVGPGVVGLQPVLRCGESFEYTSGTVIHDPIGSMDGSYEFIVPGGPKFKVAIPSFRLVANILLH